MTGRRPEPDPMLRRFERNQVLVALGLAVVAVAVSRRVDILAGVIGGAALMAVSYQAIKGGVDLIMPGTSPWRLAGPGTADAAGTVAPASNGSEPRARLARRRWALAARFVGRYALLALAAYVMLAYLHAHPVGLLLGVASPVIAVAVEAVRFIRTSSRP